MNQDIQVSGALTIRVFSGGKRSLGNQSVEVSGASEVIIASGGSLHIGGQSSKLPAVKRGQVWSHGLLRYQVLSVEDGYARCLLTDETGKVVKDEPLEVSTWQIRRLYDFVGSVARPEVQRGQINGHHVLERRYQVISVRNDVARCVVLDTDNEPITSDGKALIEDVTAVNIRYAYKLVGGAS